MNKLPGLDAYESVGAEFDAARIYRYSLHRMWGGGSLSVWRTLLWIMLNPSVADEHVLDPTLRKVEGFTRKFGFDGFEIANLYPLRATNPNDVPLHANPYGEPGVNDAAIFRAVQRADAVVVAWGSQKFAHARAAEVLKLLRETRTPLWCLGTNGDGTPKHPLYLSYNTPLPPFANVRNA